MELLNKKELLVIRGGGDGDDDPPTGQPIKDGSNS